MYTRKNGKNHGKFFVYRGTGAKSSEGEYIQGNKTGLWKTYIGDEGTLTYETNYKNDVMHGLAKAYHYDGKLKKEGNYIKGEKDGVWKWYNRNGKIEEEINYKLGKRLSEIHKSYHRNGVLEELDNYKNSKRGGVQLIYS